MRNLRSFAVSLRSRLRMTWRSFPLHRGPSPSARLRMRMSLRRLHNDADVLRTVRPGHVQELHRRFVVVLRRSLKEDHLAGIAVENVADLLRELVGGYLILVDEDPRFGHQAEDDLILNRGRREVRGCLGRHLDQIAHLHNRRDDHENDQQHEDDVDQRRDVDIGTKGTCATYLHSYPCCGAFFGCAISPTLLKPTSRHALRTSITAPYLTVRSPLTAISRSGVR